MKTMVNDVENSIDLKEDITMTNNNVDTSMALTTINYILDFGDVHCI